MSFLYPSFLWALFALSIPIIIHLLNLQRSVKLDFSSLEFLQAAKKETSSKQKLKHWLILLARCLFVAMLVLAFAQPFFSSASKKDNIAKLGVYIDNSLSMENQPYSEITALDEAKQLAIEWIESQSAADGFHLVSNNFAQTYQSRKKAIEKISQLDLTTQTLTFSEIRKKLDVYPNHQKMILISDFQKKDFQDINELKKDTNNLIELLSLNQGEEANLFIDSVWVEKANQKVQQTKVAVRIGSHGKQESEKVSVKLYLNELLVGTGLAEVNPTSGAVVNFDVSSITEDAVGYVAIEDYPITFDNKLYLKFQTASKQDLIIIDEDKNSFLHTIYDDSSLFRVHTLTKPPIPEHLKEKNAFIVYRGDAADAMSLKEEIAQGSNMIFISQDEKELAQKLNQHFGLQSNEGTIQEAQTLVLSDQNNPFFKQVFEKKQERINMPTAKQFIQTTANTALIQYPDGTPFLFSKTYGQGKIYLFTSPIDDEYSSFHQHALCIPFFYQLALSSSTFDQPMYYRSAQESINFSLQNYVATEAVHLSSIDYDVIPSQSVRNKKVILDLPKDIWMGDYTLSIGDKKIEQLAVNYPKEESKTSYYSQDDLKKIFSSNENITVFGESSMNDELLSRKLSGSSVPLWKYCVALSLLFLVIEICLIRFLT